MARGRGGGGKHLSGKWHYVAAGAVEQHKELLCGVNQVTCVAMVTDKT